MRDSAKVAQQAWPPAASAGPRARPFLESRANFNQAAEATEQTVAVERPQEVQVPTTTTTKKWQVP